MRKKLLLIATLSLLAATSLFKGLAIDSVAVAESNQSTHTILQYNSSDRDNNDGNSL